MWSEPKYCPKCDNPESLCVCNYHELQREQRMLERFSTVIAHEPTCRVLAKQMQDRGFKIQPAPEKLSHEDLVEVMIGVYLDLLREARKEKRSHS